MTIEITRPTNLRGNLLRILAEGSDYAQTPPRIFDSLYFIEWLGGEQSNLGSIAVKVLKACNRIVWTKSDGEPQYLRLTGRKDMTGTITSTCSCTSPSCTDPIT